MSKISALPEDTSPTGDDYIVSVDSGSGASKKVRISNLDSVFATQAGPQTLSNTAITKRVYSTATATTPTPDVSSYDVYAITALASDITIAAPTGTPTDGQTLLMRIKSNGSSHAIAYNAIYRAVGVTAPTTITASQLVYLGFVYNDAETKWDLIAVARS